MTIDPPPRRGDPTRAVARSAALFTLGILLTLWAAFRPHAGVRSTVDRVQTVLGLGDVTTLRTDARLGLRHWADGLVGALGQGEFNRVLAIYNRAEALGREELDRLRGAVFGGGQAAYDALPWEERRDIDGRSHDAWVFTQGVGRVAEAQGVAWAVWARPTPDADVVKRLGAAALSEEERALLADRPAGDPALAADPMLARLAGRRTTQGERAFLRLRDRVRQEGERQFRRLHHRERARIDQQSHDDYIFSRGMGALSADDRQKVSGPEVFTDDAAAEAARERLGLARLTAAERAEVSGRSRAAFAAAHDAFVEREGRRLAQAALRERFHGAAWSAERLRVHGHGGRDLIRRAGAVVELRWQRLGAGTLVPPSRVSLRWVSPTRMWVVSNVRWEAAPNDDDNTPPEGSEHP